MSSHRTHRPWRVAGAALAAAVLAAACTQKPEDLYDLHELQLSPASARVAKGTTARFDLVGVFHDRSTRDLTGQAAWKSLDESVAVVSGPGLVKGVGLGSAVIRATQGGLAAEAQVEVTPAVLESLAVTPPRASFAQGLTAQFAATGVFSDNTTQDLTAQAEWAASSALFTVTAGLVSASEPGEALVSAAFGGKSASAEAQAVPAKVASITITPAAGSAPKGITVQFRASGHLENQQTPDITDQVTWTAVPPERAEFQAAPKGLLRAKAPGAVTVTASLPIGECAVALACTTSTTFTVTDAMVRSIRVVPAALTLPVNVSSHFQALARFTDEGDAAEEHDVTRDALWSTPHPAIADVDPVEKGLVHAKAVGLAIIEASMNGWAGGQAGVVAGAAALKVSDARLERIAVTPADSLLPKGLTRQFTATGRYSDGMDYPLTNDVTWFAEPAGRVVISNAAGSRGLATAMGQGLVTIRAIEPMSSIQGSTSLNVTPAQLFSLKLEPERISAPKGYPRDFVLVARFTDNTVDRKAASWPGLAWIASPEGAIGFGQVICGPADCAQRVLTTNGAPGTTYAIRAVVVTAPFAASAHLTVTDHVIDRVEVALATPPSYFLPGGIPVTLGLAPAGDVVPVMLHVPMVATAIYSDGDRLPVTELAVWSSSKPEVAGMIEYCGNILAGPPRKGVIDTYRPDPAGFTVSAAYGGKVGSYDFRQVVPDPIQAFALVAYPSMHVGPEHFDLHKGDTGEVEGWARYAGVHQMGVWWNASCMAEWHVHSQGEQPPAMAMAGYHEASNPHVNVTALLPGFALVQPEDPHMGALGQWLLHVNEANVVEVRVTPAEKVTPLGTMVRYKAEARYSDGDAFLDRTSDEGTVWQACNTAYPFPCFSTDVAEFGRPGARKGEAYAAAEGTARIEAVFRGVTGSARLQVKLAELLAIRVEPATKTIPLGTSQRMEAWGIFTDGEHDQPITEQVTWASSAPLVARVSNAPGSAGLVTSASQGTATITAHMLDPYELPVEERIGGSALITVGPHAVLSLEIAPPCACLDVGGTLQLAAKARYTDGVGDGAEVTGQVAWTVLESPGPAVSLSPGGLVTALAEGYAIVMAAHPDGPSAEAEIKVCSPCACLGE